MATGNDIIPTWRDPADLSPVGKVARHPLIFLCSIALFAAAAWRYLHIVTPQYVSTAVLRVQQPAPQLFGVPDLSHSPDETAVFLNAEVSVLTSTVVLDAALADPAVRATQTYRAIAAAPDPLSELRKKLHGTVGRKDNLITLEYESPIAADAAIFVNSIVDAYTVRQSRQRDDSRLKMLTDLEAEKLDREALVKQTNERMLGVLRKAGSPALDSREKLLELSALHANLRAADQETASAQTQYDEAVAAMHGDPRLTADLQRINAAGAASTRTEAEEAQLRLSISEMESKRQTLVNVQNLLPSHPQVLAVEKQMDEARLQYAASAYRRLVQFKSKADQLRATLKEQEAIAQDLASRAAEYAQAELTLKRLDDKVASLETRIAAVKAGEGTNVIRIESIERGSPAVRPARPDVPRTYAVAGAAGLFFGAMGALMREGSLQRRRFNARFTDTVARRSAGRRGVREAYEVPELADSAPPTPRLAGSDIALPSRGALASKSDSEHRGRRQAD